MKSLFLICLFLEESINNQATIRRHFVHLEERDRIEKTGWSATPMVTEKAAREPATSGLLNLGSDKAMLTGHDASGSDRNFVPVNQWWDFESSDSCRPRLLSSAGLSEVGTYRHCLASDRSSRSVTRFVTKMGNFIVFELIHFNTVWLSVQKTTSVFEITKASRSEEAKRAPRRAACSSNRWIEVNLIGETRDLPRTNEMLTSPEWKTVRK